MYVNVPVTCLICSQQGLFRTERHRPRRRDPARADGAQRSRTEEEQYPRTSGQIVISASGDPEPSHCASFESIKYLKKSPEGQARQTTIARSKAPKA
ncbi:hypothetical protein T12_15232 [Trichinella patagoniensis]|uniref:Uncharacterized protein n=1 Tax=Trichinella patagoniensis TaxID=990121 RepID=A0A0V0Z4L8_9BILA|nr:hypothetical protein T12_13096 [Trichinella patagoniensis]KRY09412.1 hypothetical protein T12_15232 [Trichinella patagoniensis]